LPLFKPLRVNFVPALRIAACILATIAALATAIPAMASPAIVVDAATGDVLYADQANEPWYPASLTKLMTFYIALSAVRDHKISLDTPIMISPRANSAPPSKMGFKPGTEVTLGNGLKMMVVKSANDIAIAIAEAIAGSVEAFAEDMNATAAELGMRQSHFVNPNGLPDPAHVSSAHDLALLARAIYVTFPQEADMFNIGALRVGDEIIPTHNTLLGRYPGVDGMKTGFTCAAGFNLVASAQRDGHRYIAVVLGAPNVPLRMLKTAVLLDRAFVGIDHPEGKLDASDSASPAGAPHDMHNEVCRRRAKAAAAFQAEVTQLQAPLLAQKPAAAPALGFLSGTTAAPMTPVSPTIAMLPKPAFDPVSVYVGPAPGYQGPVAQARPPHSPIGTAPAVEPASAAAEAKPAESTEEPTEKPVVKIEGKAKTKAAEAKPHHHLAHRQAKPTSKLAKTSEPEAKDSAAAPPQKTEPAAKKPAQKSAHAKPAKKHLAKHDTPTSSKADTTKVAAPAAAAPAAQ
jgi:D-alanyl-D-alanine carboxypeptidase